MAPGAVRRQSSRATMLLSVALGPSPVGPSCGKSRVARIADHRASEDTWQIFPE
jgi:hypothetical protein